MPPFRVELVGFLLSEFYPMSVLIPMRRTVAARQVTFALHHLVDSWVVCDNQLGNMLHATHLRWFPLPKHRSVRLRHNR